MNNIDQTTKASLMVPEVYYDLISRIVPGALVIVAYGIGRISFDASIVSLHLPFALLGSYFLGFTLHMVTDQLWVGLWMPFRRILPWLKPPFRANDWPIIRGLPPALQGVYVKKKAEVALFRNCVLPAFAFAIWPPLWMPRDQWWWCRAACVVAAFVFGRCSTMHAISVHDDLHEQPAQLPNVA